MNTIAQVRSEIYDHFQSSAACQAHFFDAQNEPAYVAYYNSMYLLQDTTESLAQHRSQGFSWEPLTAYLEFWGLMQAAIIQQDSIAELHEVMLRAPLDARAKKLNSWLAVRDLRNLCAGHPAKKDLPKSHPVARTFMGRAFGNYALLTYEQWRQGEGQSHPKVNLGELLDTYALEAETQLRGVLSAMKSRWP